MAWPKGKPLPPGAGRKKGTPNKDHKEITEILARNNFDIIQEFINLYHRTCKEEYTGGVAVKCLSELATYTYHKRTPMKAEEIAPANAPIERRLKELPNKELLQLLPKAIEALEPK